MDLADLIATATPVRWFIARVVAVDALAGTVTLDYLGGLIPGVGYLDHVEPHQDDVAHGLVWDTNGMLVIGTNNKTVVRHPQRPTQLTPLAIPAQTHGTYSAGAWSPGLTQGPDHYAAWFYLAADLTTPGDVTAMVARQLSSFEIEVTRTSGGPPEFFAHTMSGVGDQLRVVDRLVAAPQTPLGVATWVPLPVRWGEQFVEGNILGFGVGGGYYSGAYSGTGRLRFSAMA